MEYVKGVPAPRETRPKPDHLDRGQAEKLTFARGDDGALRCDGVRVNRAGQSVQVSATKEVVLSAGAVNSPQILQLSGVGPAALLQQHGIEVVQDTPGVAKPARPPANPRGLQGQRGQDTEYIG